jgi:hypothetical protein
MLPGARAGSSGDRTRLDRTSCPGPSMMMPNGFARWRIPGETGSQRAASRRGLAKTGASRTQSGNDVRTTSPRLRGELRLTLDTLSHYSPVFTAPLAINSLRRRVQFFSGTTRVWAISPHSGLYAMPSLCGSAEATRGWFRAFADHSFLVCHSL